MKDTFYPLEDNIGFIKYISHYGDENFIAEVARASFNNFNSNKSKEDNIRLLKRLFNDRHTSPFEHCKITFLIKCPIFVARQLFRHRTGNFNEQSGRYSVIKNEFYIPKKDRLNKQSKSNKQGSDDDLIENPEKYIDKYKTLLNQIYDFYEESIKNELTRELARTILPQSTYTTFVWTVDLHNLANFIRLRASKEAQYEIRQYTFAIIKMLEVLYPNLAELIKNQI